MERDKVVEDFYFKKISSVLRNRELSATEIVGKLDMPKSTVTNWLKIFKASEALEARREGKKMMYSLKK